MDEFYSLLTTYENVDHKSLRQSIERMTQELAQLRSENAALRARGMALEQQVMDFAQEDEQRWDNIVLMANWYDDDDPHAA